jgi:hypothetical protein
VSEQRASSGAVLELADPSGDGGDSDSSPVDAVDEMADQHAKPEMPGEPVVADTEADGASEANDVADDAVTADPFAERDERLAGIDVSIARRLKRVLADEQNDVLDVLRRKELARSIDQLIPLEPAHLASYRDAIVDDVTVAAEAGAFTQNDDQAWVVRRLADEGVVAAVLTAINQELVDPLRQRLDRVVRDANGDNVAIGNHVRAMYRELKSQRLDDLATEISLAAYGQGRFAAIEPGTELIWHADPSCADLRTNGAAGTVPAGTAFPSGHRFPPTHAGCGCLVAAAR